MNARDATEMPSVHNPIEFNGRHRSNLRLATTRKMPFNEVTAKGGHENRNILRELSAETCIAAAAKQRKSQRRLTANRKRVSTFAILSGLGIG
jgi:hypothetical protein